MSIQETPINLKNEGRLRKIRLREEIEKTLKSFSCKDLLRKEVTDLFEIDTGDVIDKYYELKLPYSKNSFISLLSRRIKSAFTLDEMQDIHQSLLVYGTALKNKKKRWVPLNLLEPADHIHSSTNARIISRDIQQAFRIKGLNAVVKVIIHEHLVWLMTIEKQLTRRAGIKLKPPVFFCFEVGSPFLFLALGKKPSPTTLECVVKGLQYRSHKFQQIDGKDVSSLLSLLKNREYYKENLSKIEYEPGDVQVGRRTIDYSQVKARRIYSNKVLDTKEPLCVDSFTAHADTFWHDSGLVPGMAGEPLKMKIVFKAKSGTVIDMMKEMQVQNVIATPMPKYMQELIKSGKNKIRMRNPTAGAH